MIDFRLSKEAWAAAAREIEAAGRHLTDDHRTMVEVYCGLYVHRSKAGKTHPAPAEYAKAWSTVSKASTHLLKAIVRLREVGAAELEFIELYKGGYEAAKAVRESLPFLAEAAQVVAAIEAERPRVPAAANPARDWLAHVLIGLWIAAGEVPAPLLAARPRGFSTLPFARRSLPQTKNDRRAVRFATFCESMGN